MFNYGVLFSVGLVLAVVDFGACLQCIHCDNQKDPNCGLNYKNSTGTPAWGCESEESRKYIEQNLFGALPTSIFAGSAGDPYYCHKIEFSTGTVVRACLMAKQGEPIDALCKQIINNTEKLMAGKKVTKCNACDKDGCNSAGSLTISLPLTIVAFLAYYFNKQ